MEEDKDIEISKTCFKLVCIVCRKYLKETDIIYSSSTCGHVFHKQCILSRVQHATQCPQCKGKDELAEAESIKSLEWRFLDKHVTSEEMSQYGFQLGTDEEGNPIFAARYFYCCDLVPAYYIPKLKVLRFVGFHESYFIEKEIEILHVSNDNADYDWVPASEGKVPEHAFCVGSSDDNDPLYFARGFFENILRYGYLNPSKGVASILVGEKEVHNKDYEVLVRIHKDKSKKEINFK